MQEVNSANSHSALIVHKRDRQLATVIRNSRLQRAEELYGIVESRPGCVESECFKLENVNTGGGYYAKAITMIDTAHVNLITYVARQTVKIVGAHGGNCPAHTPDYRKKGGRLRFGGTQIEEIEETRSYAIVNVHCEDCFLT